jgi:hypothetical protein
MLAPCLNCYILMDVYRKRAAKKRPTAPIIGMLVETYAPALGDWVGDVELAVWEAPPEALALVPDGAAAPAEVEATATLGTPLEEKPAAVGMT